MGRRAQCAGIHALDPSGGGNYKHVSVPLRRGGRELILGLPQRKADDMANIRSAKKRIRQTRRKTAVNRDRLGRVRTFVKKVEAAIAAGDRDAAGAALREAEPEIMRGVTKGVLHRNAAARKVSRLSARIKAL